MTRAKLDRTAFRKALSLPKGAEQDDNHFPKGVEPAHPLMQSTESAPYPVPQHAAHIWLANGELHIGLPPTSPDSRGTTVSIPLDKCGIVPNDSGMAPRADQMGWQVLLATLSSRSRRARSQSTIGTDSCPVQYDIERVLKAMGRTSVPKAAKGGKIQLTDEDLGL